MASPVSLTSLPAHVGPNGATSGRFVRDGAIVAGTKRLLYHPVSANFNIYAS